MNFADLFKKNIIFIPVVASIVVGSFTGIKYVLNLTTTINQSELEMLEDFTEDSIEFQQEDFDKRKRRESAESSFLNSDVSNDINVEL